MYEFAKYDTADIILKQDAIIDAFVKANKESFKGQTLSTSKCIQARADAWKREMDLVMKGRAKKKTRSKKE